MYLSKSEINLIKAKFNIVEIIKTFIELKKTSTGFFALCPFHKEKTPSFFVSEYKQMYYCFGCNKVGDVIIFIMSYKNIDFISAIKFLLKGTNICSDYESLESSITYLKILKKICVTYYSSLLKNKECNEILKNFLKERSLDDEILEKFKIGYVEDSWNFISEKVKINRKLEEKLIELGILIKKNNHIYDRFRNRIIFPIRNYIGNIVGFGGRVLDDSKPKYINSPESFIFSKKSELYGIYESTLGEKFSYVIVVEGYIDVLLLHKNGITNSVGILGSSFTIEHFKIIIKNYKKIIFCFDGDEAGLNAALRTAYSCFSYIGDVFIGFVFLPNGEDPDSYIKKFGKENFLKLIKNPIYILDYIFESLSKNLNKNYLYDQISLLKDIKKILKNIKDEDLRDLIFQYYKKKLGIQNFSSKKILIEENDIGIRASCILLKNKEFIEFVNLDKIISKNIKFTSSLNIFLKLAILIKNNIKISDNELKFRMQKNFFLIEKSFKNFRYKSNEILNEFLILLNKIYNY